MRSHSMRSFLGAVLKASFTKIPTSAKALLVASSVALAADAAPPSFQSVGHDIEIRAISADGKVLIGTSNDQACRFSLTEGITTLPLIEGAWFTEATAVSDDGSVIVGHSDASGSGREATVWDSSGVRGLGRPDGSSTSARCVSRDGTVVYGLSKLPSLSENTPGETSVFQWTEALEMQLFDSPAGVIFSSSENTEIGAARDGSCVFALGSAITDIYTRHLVRWDENGNSTAISPPQGYVFSDGLQVAGNGTAFARVAPAYLPQESRITRWARVNSTTAELLPLLSHEGLPNRTQLVAVSDDAETLIFSVGEEHCYRLQGGVYTHLGLFLFTGASEDCEAIVGINSFGHPVIWTEASGLRELLPTLRDQLGNTAPMGGDWYGGNGGLLFQGLQVAKVDDQLTIAGHRMSREPGGTQWIELSAASLAEPPRYAGDLLMGKATAVFVEKRSASSPSEIVYQNSLKVVVPLRAGEATAFGADTSVEIALGTFLLRTTLGSDPDYSPGATTAKFATPTSDLELSWTETALTARLSTYRGPDQGAGSAEDKFFLGEYEPRGALSFRIGDRSGTRAIQATRTNSKKIIEPGLPAFITIKGGIDYTAPELNLSIPKKGAIVTTDFARFTAHANEDGSTLYYRLNGGEWLSGSADTNSKVIFLAAGENLLEVKAVDRFGNASRITSRKITHLPREGSYHGTLFVDDSARGFFSVQMRETGAFTGVIVLDKLRFPIKGQLDEGNSAELAIGRRGEVPHVIELRLRTETGRPELKCIASVVIAKNLEVLALGNATRSQWASPMEANLVLGDPHFSALLQRTASAPANLQGSGVMWLQVDTERSKVVGGGKLADGNPFTFSAPLSESLMIPIRTKLRVNGLLTGTLQFDSSNPLSDITGPLRWYRREGGPGPFASGWDTIVNVIGSRLGTEPFFPSRTLNGEASPSAQLRFSLNGGDVLLPVFNDEHIMLSTAFNPFDGRPFLQSRITTLFGSGYRSICAGSFMAGQTSRTNFAVAKVSKANLLGGFFLTPTGSGSVSIEAAP